MNRRLLLKTACVAILAPLLPRNPARTVTATPMGHWLKGVAATTSLQSSVTGGYLVPPEYMAKLIQCKHEFDMCDLFEKSYDGDVCWTLDDLDHLEHETLDPIPEDCKAIALE